MAKIQFIFKTSNNGDIFYKKTSNIFLFSYKSVNIHIFYILSLHQQNKKSKQG